jgi:hypothetical protein
MNSNIKQNLVFTVIFIGLSIHFRFFETINLPPQSTDLWRQADCYSIALNYYQHGFDFFKPQVHFQFTQQGYAAGEFPLIYFLSAILFKIFGIHYFLFKGLNLMIFFCGLFALFKILLKHTTDLFLSCFFSVLYFCTPVVFFYANNFLSDVSALSFNIIGLYFFIRFTESKTGSMLLISGVCFALAGLLKASATIFLIAIICALISQHIIKEESTNQNSFSPKQRLLLLLSYFMALSLIVSWYVYAIKFNQANKTVFFGTKAMKGWPLWENTYEQLIATLKIFWIIHIEILSSFNLILFVVFIILILLFRKKTNSFYLSVWLFLGLGLGMFITYFWKGFEDQQYYLVNLLILPLLSVILAAQICQTYNLTARFKLYAYGVLSVCLLMVVYKSKNVYKCYYKGGWRHQKLTAVYYDSNTEKQLINHGISKDSKIISLIDGTPNGTLSMLNRKGWSSYGFDKNSNYSEIEFESKIALGARYLIINDTALLKNKIIQKYTAQPLGNYQQLYFYKLPQLQ